MRDLRNPFRLQTAESIELDQDFLRLFGPGVLDLISDEAPWSRPQFIRSAPGGGKTSLLKLFTPSVLLTLIALRGAPDCKDLFQRLRQLNVVDEHDVRVIGVMLTCRQTFPDLDDLGLPAPRARRLLLALLDARVMIGALRAALTARRLRYPDDLARVALRPTSNVAAFPGLALPSDGLAARDWAEALEKSICDVIDSLYGSGANGPPGHDVLLTLRLLDENALLVDDTPVGERWLLLLDDVQKLTLDQRVAMRETLVEERSRSTIWFAERLEALSTDELLAPGALAGRDYGNVVNLEEAWRKHRNKFDASAATIAERRARMAADAVSGSLTTAFAASLDDNLESGPWIEKTNAALQIVSSRIQAIAEKDVRYAEWVRVREAFDGTPRERLIAWRALEILIERHRRKKQQTLVFVTEDELEEKDDSAVKAAAELFIAREFQLPYYFGPSKLSGLGSFNVEQYLRLAGDFFEEILGNAVLRRPQRLSAERQEEILRSAYDVRVRDFPRRSKKGREVLAFIDAVGSFCKWATHQPNAPYAPGVTGIAISMKEREMLLDSGRRALDLGAAKLADILATALAHNLLHAELDKPVKNGRYMVLYLNRLLCPKFELPTHFGGFREKPLREFVGWMNSGFRPTKTEPLPL